MAMLRIFEASMIIPSKYPALGPEESFYFKTI
jgi:hypothetical protein